MQIPDNNCDSDRCAIANEVLLDRLPGIATQFGRQNLLNETCLRFFAQLAIVVGDIAIVAVGDRERPIIDGDDKKARRQVFCELCCG